MVCKCIRPKEDEDIRRVAVYNVDGRRNERWAKQRRRDAMQSVLKRYDLNRSEVDDRVRWHLLIELRSLQKSYPDRTTAA